MSQLIRQFCEGIGVHKVPVQAQSMAHKLHTVWIQSALSDPCLFHATLFSGSSYHDLLRGQQTSWITILHQNEVISLVNNRLSDLSTALDERTIAAIVPLCFFAVLSGDRSAADAHCAGLEKLVELKGGHEKLGFGGIVAGLIHQVVYDVIFDLDASCTFSNNSSATSAGLETRILEKNVQTSLLDIFTICKLKNLFQEVFDFKLQDALSEPNAAPAGSFHYLVNQVDDFHAEPEFQSPIYSCCYLAVRIFWLIVVGREDPVPFTARLNYACNSLKSFLALLDEGPWLHNLPEVYVWICMTGAAAADNSRLRVWFWTKQLPIASSLTNYSETSFYDDLWLHFRWLRIQRLKCLPTTTITDNTNCT
ncbi:hypothetical protein BJX63DRAFT_413781 [Aspergillus granulosus]|uniref:Uncharacterized protein n=1 Tax=Aspergillus granulosus TaxID=176169 RepID=A0ABR4GV88_9EURO